jgi:hypothetical protein
VYKTCFLMYGLVIVSDISCLWGLDIKEWVKTHLSKVSGDDAPVVNSKQDRAVHICAPKSTVHSECRTPLAFRSLSRGGGVRDRGRNSPTAQISTPRSMAIKRSLEPPLLSAFKREGGVRDPMCSFPTARIVAPRSTALVQSHSSQLSCV